MGEKMVELVVPLILVVGGFLVGIVVEKLVLARLRRIAARTKWEWDEIVINSLRWMPTLWFVVVGVRMAVHKAPVSPSFVSNFDKAMVVLIIVSVTVILG